MKEALHVVENKLYRIGNLTSTADIQNYKQLAKKGLFRCQYCNAELLVRSGEIKETHFAHWRSESCEESRIIEFAEKKYENQTKRESPQHRAVVDRMYDELKVQSHYKPLNVEYGYKAKTQLSEFPDVWVEMNGKEFALCILTNVNPHEDSKLSKKIVNRHQYFIRQGMTPIWFVENRQIAIEKEKNAIILWDARTVIASKTEEDTKWGVFLKGKIKDLSFFEPYHYVPSMNKLFIDVRSMYYLYTRNDQMVVRILRFMSDRMERPCRAFFAE